MYKLYIIFRKYTQKTYLYISKFLSRKCNLNTHFKKIHEKIRNKKCDTCGKTFWGNKDLDNHIKTIHEGLRNTFECQLCGRGFAQSHHLKIHIESVHQKEFKTEQKCKICYEIFLDLKDLKEHIKITHQNNQVALPLNQCTYCQESFYGKTLLENHMKKIHPELLPKKAKDPKDIPTCHICGKTQAKWSITKAHIKAVHEKTYDHNCSMCKKVFSDPYSLQKHFRFVHEKISNHKCDFCGKGLSDRKSLLYHLDAFHRPKEFKCEKCDHEIFEDKKSYNDHMKNVHNAFQENACSICGKTFTQKSQIKVHLREVHEKSKIHKCDICFQSFTHKNQLKTHIEKIHECQNDDEDIQVVQTVEEIENMDDQGLKLKCGICGKINWPPELRNHFKNVHEGNKEHTCDACGKGFTTERMLAFHIKTIHEGQKTKICNICGEAFKYYNNLKKHLMAVHEVEQNPSTSASSKENDFKEKLKVLECKQFNDKSNSIGDDSWEELPVRTFRERKVQIYNNKEEGDFDDEISDEEQNVRSKCEVCGRIFFKQEMLDSHVKKVHEGKKLEPANAAAGENIIVKSEIEDTIPDDDTKWDIQKDKESKRFKCDACDCVYTRRNLLNNHVKVVHKGKGHKCDICGKIFATKWDLTRHVSCVHEKKRIFCCQMCPKSYANKADLDRHMRDFVHENKADDKFECE